MECLSEELIKEIIYAVVTCVMFITIFYHLGK